MPKLESDLLQSLEKVGRGEGRGRRCNDWRSPLEGEPGVAQALGGRGSLLGHQLQHGKQEVGKALCLLPRPLVLVDQHLQQAPGLQLGNVFQVTCSRPHSAASEPPRTHATGISTHSRDSDLFPYTLKQLGRLIYLVLLAGVSE